MDFRSALTVRRNVFQSAVLLVFCVILINLFYLMVHKHTEYEERALKNRQVQLRQQAPRGRITDRVGIPLADNRFLSDITLPASTLAEGKMDSTLAKLLTWFALPVHETMSDLRTQQRRGRKRVVLVRDADMAKLMAVEERREHLPGVRIESRLRRRYPWGPLFAHVIGYTGEVDKEELDRVNEGRSALGMEPALVAGEFIGKQGVELAYEEQLRGRAGIKIEEVNASGRIVGRETFWQRAVQPGRDVALTLSLPLQQGMDSLLAGRMGSAVALSIPSGEVLVAVSSPSFNPNHMTAPISHELWRELIEDPAKPFFNRIVQGTYAPGSLYKTITSLACLAKGVVDTNTVLDPCMGGFHFGNRYARCWLEDGHGLLNHTDALAHSCGVYYYQLGLRLTVDELSAAGRAFGLGSTVAGIFPEEVAGNLPDSAWYDRRFGRGHWTRGVLLNNAIGQGEILVTPLQMALLAARLAFDGRVPGPTFVMGQRPAISAVDLPFAPQHMSWIRRALRRVVDAGTGRAARMAGVPVAGKTGTAENVHGANHAWFMCYAPADAPEVAVAVILEHGGGGGTEAAPLVGAWLRLYFDHGLDGSQRNLSGRRP
jgi:penicillin-binding protein 2